MRSLKALLLVNSSPSQILCQHSLCLVQKAKTMNWKHSHWWSVNLSTLCRNFISWVSGLLFFFLLWSGGPLPPRLSPAVGGRRVSSPCILEDGQSHIVSSGCMPLAWLTFEKRSFPFLAWANVHLCVYPQSSFYAFLQGLFVIPARKRNRGQFTTMGKSQTPLRFVHEEMLIRWERPTSVDAVRHSSTWGWTWLHTWTCRLTDASMTSTARTYSCRASVFRVHALSHCFQHRWPKTVCIWLLTKATTQNNG